MAPLLRGPKNPRHKGPDMPVRPPASLVADEFSLSVLSACLPVTSPSSRCSEAPSASVQEHHTYEEAGKDKRQAQQSEDKTLL